jgi:hypothetical protein
MSNRKADELAKNQGSVANKLKEQRQTKAKRLEEITGIKQPTKKKSNWTIW